MRSCVACCSVGWFLLSVVCNRATGCCSMTLCTVLSFRSKGYVGNSLELKHVEHRIIFHFVTIRKINLWEECRKPSSGILRRVFLVRTDVSEERIASILRADESRWEYMSRCLRRGLAGNFHVSVGQPISSRWICCVYYRIVFHVGSLEVWGFQTCLADSTEFT
jgi:hypothetical protein